MWLEVAAAMSVGIAVFGLLAGFDWVLGQLFDSIVCIDEKETHRGEED